MTMARSMLASRAARPVVALSVDAAGLRLTAWVPLPARLAAAVLPAPRPLNSMSSRSVEFLAPSLQGSPSPNQWAVTTEVSRQEARTFAPHLRALTTVQLESAVSPAAASFPRPASLELAQLAEVSRQRVHMPVRRPPKAALRA
jgi:hypothetical protein